jgi:hypothetical protein
MSLIKKFTPQKDSRSGVAKNVEVQECLNDTDLRDAADLVKHLFGEDKKGPLFKQSGGGKWQKRFFAAREDCLFYFGDQEEVASNTAKGCVKLSQVSKIQRDGSTLHLILGGQSFSLKHESETYAVEWERDLTNRIGVRNALKGLKRILIEVPEGKGGIGMTVTKHNTFDALVVMKLHHEKNGLMKAPMRGEAAGMREDDLLICIDGHRCKTEESAKRLLGRTNGTVSIVLWRGALASQLATHLRLSSPGIVGGVCSPSGRRCGEYTDAKPDDDQDKVQKQRILDQISSLAFDLNRGMTTVGHTPIRINDGYNMGKVIDSGSFGLVRVATIKGSARQNNSSNSYPHPHQKYQKQGQQQPKAVTTTTVVEISPEAMAAFYRKVAPHKVQLVDQVLAGHQV